MQKLKLTLGPSLAISLLFLVFSLVWNILWDVASVSFDFLAHPLVLIGKDGVFSVLVACALGAYLAREQRDQEAREIELLSFAMKDPLTGLINRPGLKSHIDAAVRRARGSNLRFGLVYIDLNNFKAANDYFGRAFGDAVLKAFTVKLRGLLRADDVAGRLGADEFVVLVAPDHATGVEKLLERVTAAFQEPLDVEGFAYPIKVSIGVAHFPEAGSDAEALLSAADIDMYRTKRGAPRQEADPADRRAG